MDPRLFVEVHRKQLRLVDEELGSIPARQLRPEQIAGFISDLLDRGSASRARNVRTLLVQVTDQAVDLGLAAENVAKRVKTPKVPRVKDEHGDDEAGHGEVLDHDRAGASGVPDQVGEGVR